MSRVARSAGIVVAAILVLIAILHGLWGFGATWPAADEHDLARTYVGQQDMPPRPLILAVAVLIAVAPVLLLARSGVFGAITARYPRLLVTVGSWGVAIVLLGRGFVFFGNHVVGFSADTAPEFIRPDLIVYSPLCIVLGAGAALAAWAGDRSEYAPAGGRKSGRSPRPLAEETRGCDGDIHRHLRW